MAETGKATIGFVSGGASSMPHYNSFLPLIPQAVKMDFQGLNLYRDSLYEIENKKDLIVRRVQELILERMMTMRAIPSDLIGLRARHQRKRQSDHQEELAGSVRHAASSSE